MTLHDEFCRCRQCKPPYRGSSFDPRILPLPIAVSALMWGMIGAIIAWVVL